MEYLEKLDAWLERGEGGSIPIDLLHERGVEFPSSTSLDDAKLNAKLWEILEAMSAIGLYVTFTDHLSDRQLYDRLVNEILLEEAFLDPDDPCMGEVCDLIGNGTEEANRIYLVYYADEEERQDWAARFGDPLPPRIPRPHDRDRFLPSLERRAFSPNGTEYQH
jgi:hypothetical protein